MQERVYNKGKIANVEELRPRIVDEWERLDQRIIDGAVKEWRKRLNELWNVTFCHKTRRVCNVQQQNSCDKFYKVV